MRIGNLIHETEVEGPGIRSGIWFQGCSIRCPDCCNPHYFSPEGGIILTPEALAAEILSRPGEGLSLLGGEPLDQADELLVFLDIVRQESDKSVMLFTGHTWNHLQANPSFRSVVERCDLVKAGPFVKTQAPDTRRWVGSSGQTLHFITGRYRALEHAWEPAKREIEIRITGEEIIINGTPLRNDLLFSPRKD